MATPSITMIPSGYKAQKVYSVLPTNGDGDLTFDRNNVGTRVNENGLIEQVATDVPRLDYSDGSCPSLLLEPASTNLAGYSEDFSQVWNKNNSTVTTNQTTSPSGDLTADKFISDDTNQPRVERAFTVPATDTTYTFSVFVKKINTRYIGLSRFSGGEGAIFDFDTKSVVSSSAENASIKEFSNDWFRISITQTVLSIDSYNIWKINGTNGSSIGTGVVGDETFIWGAQLEEKPYATSYIPTPTVSPESRGSDSAIKDGLSSYISSTAGVLYLEISALVSEDSSTRIISLNDGGNINRVFIGFLSSGRTYSAINNQPVAYFTPTDPTDFHKVAIKYEDNNTKFFANGNQIGSTETTQTVPSGLNQIRFTDGGTSNPFHGKVKDLRVYNTALTDAELITLTTI